MQMQMGVGQKIVVFGASGFIGSALTESLVSAGHNVIGVVRQNVLRPGPVRHIVVADSRSLIDKIAGELKGASTAIHLIARTHSRDTDDKRAEGLYRSTNID